MGKIPERAQRLSPYYIKQGNVITIKIADSSVKKQNINRIAHPCSPEGIPSLSECRQRFIIVVLWNSGGNEESNSGVTLHAIDRLECQLLLG